MNYNTKSISILISICSIISINCFSQEEPYINTLFFEDFDGESINTSIWQVAGWTEHGGQTSAERCYIEDGFLKMIFINDSEEGFLNAAIQTRNEFLFGKWEARIKPSNIPGILNSFYTIDWNNFADRSSSSNGTKQEIDIEFLTYTFAESSGKVHFATHEQNKISFQTDPDISLDFNPSDDFHVWGFEITPEYVEWFVDDTPLKRYTYGYARPYITSPYQLKLNVWSAESWINGPPTADVECEYLIDWIRFTPKDYSTSNVADIKMKGNELEVHPNPFNDKISFKSFDENITQQTELNIFDLNGKILFKKIFNKGEQIYWSGNNSNGKILPAGMYFFKLKCIKSGTIYQGKIIKK